MMHSESFAQTWATRKLNDCQYKSLNYAANDRWLMLTLISVVLTQCTSGSGTVYEQSCRWVNGWLRELIDRPHFAIQFTSMQCNATQHWRRQLWGTGARAPRLPASYFGDRSLYGLWRVMRTVFCPVERFLAIGSADCHWIVPQIRKMYKNNAIFAQFYQFLAHFCHFLPTVFLTE